MKLLVINGPNLNMLGIREPKIYGKETYEDLLKFIGDICAGKGVEVEFFQSNHEGDIIDRIQAAYKKSDALIINPGGYTHTSVAIPDAIKAVDIPTVEVHLSDVSSREEFRKISYVSYVAKKTIYGKGFDGYKEAIEFLEDFLERGKTL